MTNEAVVLLLMLAIFVFSVWLACGIQSLSQKIDRIEAIIKISKRRQEAKTGYWYGPECSACHAILEKKANYEWCPYCGAHMIEEVK